MFLYPNFNLGIRDVKSVTNSCPVRPFRPLALWLLFQETNGIMEMLLFITRLSATLKIIEALESTTVLEGSAKVFLPY